MESNISNVGMCDTIIDYFYDNQHRHKRGTVEGGDVDSSHKQSIDLTITPDNDHPIWNDYIDSIQPCLDEYVSLYPTVNNNARFYPEYNINIQRYYPNEGFFGWHFERTGREDGMKRLLVFMTYLNTVTDGGETEFYYQKKKIKPVKGKTVIWSADWMHTHRGVVSPTETKYIITGWYSFP